MTTDMDQFLERIRQTAEAYPQLARWARSDDVGEATKGVFDLRERVIVERLTALREAMGISQSELAKRMTARGFPMQQSTVAKIERHARPVRMAEFFGMCAALGVPDLAIYQGASLPGESEELDRYAALSESMASAIESRENLRARLVEDVATWAGMFAERDAEVLWLGSLLQQAAIEAERKGEDG